jgi:2,4-dienoyl-CoA reductase (NADPH2)
VLYPHLFSPIDIGGLGIPNRINMPPMHTNLGNRLEGITEEGCDFYLARARGGFGLMGIGIIDAYFVEGASSPLEFFLDNDRHIKNYARLTKEIKRYGAVPYAQVGVRRLFPVKLLHREDRPTLADFSEETIEEMIQAVVSAAVRAAEAGFSAVDILGVGGSAHSIFMSQVFNNRTDKWGGSRENRVRFATETVSRIKRAVGSGFPVFYRLHGSEFLKGGYGLEGAKFNAQQLEKAGVCFFNVTGGGHGSAVPQLTPNVPRGTYAYLAREIGAAVKSPVAASNRNNQPDEAEKILRDGWADMISLGRQSLADPDWPTKVKASQFDDIRYCVACNECLDSTVINDQPVVCLVNPQVGIIPEMDNLPVAKKVKKVVVVGGGVAGLQLALTSAQRGHQVTLFEKEKYLGGMWHYASAPPGREELFSFLKWLVVQVTKLNIDIQLGTEATAETVAELEPDVVAVSMGNTPFMPDIPRSDGSNVLPATDALGGRAKIGKKVVIIGGGGIGVEVAPYLAERTRLRPDILSFLQKNNAVQKEDEWLLDDNGGHEVTMTTRQNSIGGSVGSFTRWVLAREVNNSDVNVMYGTTAQHITDDGVVIVQNGKEELIEADTVLLAGGLIPNRSSYDALKGSGISAEFYALGESGTINHAIEAVREAYQFAVNI